MEKKDEWNTFLQTGSALDYLRYKGCINSDAVKSSGKQDDERARNNRSDGDGTTSHSRFRL